MEIDVRDNNCDNCAKFSHCNNNELVCIKKFQQLKAENEELKHKVKLMMDCPDCKVNEYKQCLDEIEEIAKRYSKMCNGAGGQSITIQSRHLGMTEVGREILQKIKEVKGNR